MLSAAQHEAVKHGGGPLLILGGAGTGKTAALIERFAWLAERPGDALPAESILVLSPAAEALRERIEELDRWLGPAVNHGAGAAGRPGPAREALLDAFEQLDGRLARSRYLLGDRLTEADIRLWVTLVRYDVGPNAYRTVNPGLHVYPYLWSYARALYRIPAFRDTTDFTAFARADTVLPDWDAPADR